MRPTSTWRTLAALSVIVPLTAYSGIRPNTGRAAASPPTAPTLTSRVHIGSLTAADVARLSANATDHVIVVLRDQHSNLPARGASRISRFNAIASDQQGILSELSRLHAPRVHPFRLINAIAATISPAEATRLSHDPVVRAVVPDRTIKEPAPLREQAAAAATGVSAGAVTAAATTPCTTGVSLEPEALQLTNALSLPTGIDGTGVTVAFMADGVDTNNTDFVRPDGSKVFVDYEDFTGDGPEAPTAGGEAFGDASSIAAQGRVTYTVTNNPAGPNDFINPTYPAGTTCHIRIQGMAPGASLVGLKVFSNQYVSTDSNFVQAIEYAVTHGVDVLNQSFGANPFPDNANDPISLADDAAVAAGVTVVASTGDAGTAGTVGSPASDPNVIAAGASTQFRFYAQTGSYGFQLSNGGYVDDNISSFSSAGITQRGDQTVDVVAPGDLSWADCTPSPVYADCTDFAGNLSQVESFGGTSEAAPLTSGEAALVIQAYRQAHGGASPTPALVKQIIKSTATDLNIPAYEQGDGLIDAGKAVQAALSYQGTTPQGNALLVAPGTLSATDAPNTPESFSVQVTNASTATQMVAPHVRVLGPPTYSQSFTPVLNPAVDPTFIDQVGAERAYVKQTFTVPAAADRLDAAISWAVAPPTSVPPFTLVRLTLLDPQGRYTAFTIPQDSSPPYNASGYGHVDVRNPQAGTWTAIIWTKTSGSGGYKGLVHLDVSTSNFVSAGSVSPASKSLAPGETTTFNVSTSTPAQPGDESAEVVFDNADGSATVAGAVPINLRSLVPLGPNGGSFSGTLTGGNGRLGSPGQTLTYAFNVPGGLNDLDLNMAITDLNYNLMGVLVDPNGLPLDVQSSITSEDPKTGLPTAYTNTLQFFRRNPQAGLWKLVLVINDSSSGQQTALPFTANITFNGARVDGSAVPDDPGVTLAYSTPVTVPVYVTNSGNTTESYFADPRLNQYGPLFLGSVDLSVPITQVPEFIVPPESDSLIVAAQSTVPISMDIANNQGAPPYGFTGSPDIEAVSSGNIAVARSLAPEVAFGPWAALPQQVGPYGYTGAAPVVAAVGALADTQQFDPAMVPDTGDAWGLLTGQTSAPYNPLVLTPGQLGTINVVITPDAAPGTVVTGTLYIDTFNPFTFSGDEVTAIPYAYTVGAPPTPTDTATPTGTATVTPTATMTPTDTVTPTATMTPTETVTPTGTVSATDTATPLPTDTDTPVPTDTDTPVPTDTATPVPTDTATPMPTDTDTPVPTDTDTPVPTDTATPLPTDTPTATPTMTPPSVCELYVVPAFRRVTQGGDQAVIFAAAPNSRIKATVFTHGGYPSSATLYTDRTLAKNGFGRVIYGKRITQPGLPTGFRYSFRVESSGLALLTFHVPSRAPTGTAWLAVYAQEPCGTFGTVATFQVTQAHHESAAARGATSGASHTTHSRVVRLATVRVTLPRRYTLPAGARALMRHGTLHVATVGHGSKTTHRLTLAYRPGTH